LRGEKEMPIYEYTCLNCGAEFEKLVWRSQDIGEVKCPACDEPGVEEKISSCASFMKGGSSAGGGGSCAPSGG